jgi:hypothetical protein
MNEINSINHEPRTLYLPVTSSGRLGRAPISNRILYLAEIHWLWTIACSAIPSLCIALGFYNEEIKTVACKSQTIM